MNVKKTTRWTAIVCSAVLAVSLLAPASASAAKTGSVYEQLKAQYPAKVESFTKAGISEKQLRTFLQDVLDALVEDRAVTKDNFDSMLIKKSVGLASADLDLYQKVTGTLTNEESTNLLKGKIPVSWEPMREVLRAEWERKRALIIQIEKPAAQQAEVIITKDMIIKGKAAGQTLEVLFGTNAVIKVDFAQLPEFDLVLQLEIVNRDAVSTELMPFKLKSYGETLNVRLISNVTGAEQEVKLTGKGFIETHLILPSGVKNKDVGAYYVNLGLGHVQPLPMKITTSGVNRFGIVHHRGSGSFVLAHKEKAVTFSDTAGNWSQANIELLTAKSILSGYADGTFRPTQKVTRAELVAMITRSLGLFAGENPQSRFTDIKNDAWYNGAVTAAVEAKLISGDPDGRFRPNDNITRQEVAAIFGNAITMLEERIEPPTSTSFDSLTFKDKSNVAPWAQTAVGKVASHKIMNGYQDNTFGPRSFTTRAEVAAMLVNLLGQSHLLTK